MHGTIGRFALGFPRNAGLQSGIGNARFTSLMQWIEAIDSSCSRIACSASWGVIVGVLPVRFAMAGPHSLGEIS
jgi:hypothetical protein